MPGKKKKLQTTAYLHKAILFVDSALEFANRKETPLMHTISSDKQESDDNFQPEWTAKVINLVEIALSVHAARSMNHGRLSATAVVKFFFRIFGLNPGNFFSYYAVMRTRAGSRTSYLDELKKGLEEKMNQDDKKKERQRKNK